MPDSDARGRTDRPFAARPPDARALPILVVEDLDDDYETVAEAARRAGVPNPLVRVATLAEARDAVAEADFSFVLLDVNLPDGSGTDLVRQLRTDRKGRTVPVVVFSTSDNPRDLRDLYEAGANAYHAKGLRYPENLRTLDDIFSYWLASALLADRPSA